MLRLSLCHKLPCKLLPLKVSTSASHCVHSLASQSSLSISRHGSDGNDAVNCDRTGEKSFIGNNAGFSVQSITPFPFDDVAINGNQTDATRVQVLEQWKHLLDSLKTIVDSFHGTRTTVQDVAAVCETLERHHLVKLLVKPYGYTANDVIDHAESSFDPRDGCGDVKHPEGFLPEIETPSQGKLDKVGGDVSTSCVDRLIIRRSFIDRLERESLRAASVLSSGTWKSHPDVVFLRRDAFDSTFANCSSEESGVLSCRAAESRSEGNGDSSSENRNRPNRDHLLAVQNYMADNLPKILVKFHSYDIYTNDVIFENNWYMDQSYITVGVTAYALEIAKLRLFVHLRYANVKMQLLKMTTDETEGTVHVRWRISGIPQVKAIMFWKFLPWTNRSSAAVESEWLDGFSTYFVDGSGLIYKHRMDRVIPDKAPELKKNPTVMEKIAGTMAAPVAT